MREIERIYSNVRDWIIISRSGSVNCCFSYTCYHSLTLSLSHRRRTNKQTLRYTKTRRSGRWEIHTHTHTQRERERERELYGGWEATPGIFAVAAIGLRRRRQGWQAVAAGIGYCRETEHWVVYAPRNSYKTSHAFLKLSLPLAPFNLFNVIIIIIGESGYRVLCVQILMIIVLIQTRNAWTVDDTT